MNQQVILNKLSEIYRRFVRNEDDALLPDKSTTENTSSRIEDDLPLTLARDVGPGVTYYDTENSEFANGAEKDIAHGIDSFEEARELSFEEADDFQTNRDRHQNSDLSQRFYTGGLDIDELNKQ
jgi:hypothetical protein